MTVNTQTQDLDHLRATGPRWRRVVGRAGLVLAGLQALPNIANGGFQLVDPPTVAGEKVPLWVGLSLLVAGLVTLAALVPAWRGSARATWAVALSRLSEVSGLLVFVGAFPAEDGDEVFYVVLAAVSTLIAAMVLIGRRPGRDRP